MKKIKLTQGKFVIVDDADFEYLNQWKWFLYKHPGCRTSYAVRDFWVDKKNKRVQMHRLILNAPSNFQVDHISKNGLDNRRRNLRLATASQNKQNEGLRLNNTSGYKGVSWYTQQKKWGANIWLNNKKYFLGLFLNKKEAARIYNKKAKEYYSEYASFNQI